MGRRKIKLEKLPKKHRWNSFVKRGGGALKKLMEVNTLTDADVFAFYLFTDPVSGIRSMRIYSSGGQPIQDVENIHRLLTTANIHEEFDVEILSNEDYDKRFGKGSKVQFAKPRTTREGVIINQRTRIERHNRLTQQRVLKKSELPNFSSHTQNKTAEIPISGTEERTRGFHQSIEFKEDNNDIEITETIYEALTRTIKVARDYFANNRQQKLGETLITSQNRSGTFIQNETRLECLDPQDSALNAIERLASPFLSSGKTSHNDFSLQSPMGEVIQDVLPPFSFGKRILNDFDIQSPIHVTEKQPNLYDTDKLCAPQLTEPSFQDLDNLANRLEFQQDSENLSNDGQIYNGFNEIV